MITIRYYRMRRESSDGIAENYLFLHNKVSIRPVDTVTSVPISVYQVQAIDVKSIIYTITIMPVMKAGMACLI